MPAKVEGKPFCWRKVMYTYDAAVRALQTLQTTYHEPDMDLAVYHCPECAAYHIGHDRRKQ